MSRIYYLQGVDWRSRAREEVIQVLAARWYCRRILPSGYPSGSTAGLIRVDEADDVLDRHLRRVRVRDRDRAIESGLGLGLGYDQG